ncbi:MAG: NTP transferase domain-containing protein, partial [Patescibacteria group bacterium]|nr:NTP transferase domain-containing protein [Patescibacteria group bacterium]
RSQPWPKVLAPLKGRPLISYILDEVKKLELELPPVVVVGFMQDKVRQELGAKYLYAFQEQQLGTGHAAAAAKSLVTAKNVVVLYGDMPFIRAESLKNLIQTQELTGDKLSMFTATVKNFDGPLGALEKYGRIIRNSSGDILKITEYKDCTAEEKQIKEVNPGVYCFDSQWLWANIGRIDKQNTQSEYYLTDMLEIAVGQGERVNSLPITPEEVLGINTWEDHGHAENLIV